MNELLLSGVLSWRTSQVSEWWQDVTALRKSWYRRHNWCARTKWAVRLPHRRLTSQHNVLRIVTDTPTQILVCRWSCMQNARVVGVDVKLFWSQGDFAIRKTKTSDPEVRHKRKIGMIAGGTGITPMLQVVRHVIKYDDDSIQLSLLFANQVSSSTCT